MSWQPIETAPKDGTAILLCNEREVTVGFYSTPHSGKHPWFVFDSDLTDGTFINGWQDHSEYGPSHWMPLPEPPKE